MSPTGIKTGHCSLFTSYAGYLLYFLSICLVFFIWLFMRSIRLRQPIVDTENNLSDALFAEASFLEKPSLGFLHATALEESIQAFEFDNPLADNTLITSTHYTSGFLAARADIERMENKSWHLEVPDMDSISKHGSTTSSLATDEECAAKQVLCSSTRSDVPPAQRPACPFRDLAQHDFTEQFPDEHDPQVFWRRRTMVFGTNP